MNEQEIDQLPTGRSRYILLHAALGRIAGNYRGEPPGEHSRLCRQAVRDTLGVPADAGGLALLAAFAPHREVYESMLAAFTEVLQLGLHYENYKEPDNVEAVTANTAWSMFIQAYEGVHLSDAERKLATCDAMLCALEYWLTFTTGGLMQATLDLYEMMGGDQQ